VHSAWADDLYPKYFAQTIESLKTAGLEVIEQLGDYQKTSYSSIGSPAMILVAQKLRNSP